MKKNTKQEQEQETSQNEKKKRKKPGGGAWRAFVHFHSKGEKCGGDRFSELARMYRGLSSEERQVFVEAGEAAVRARHAGFKSFHTTDSDKKKRHIQNKRALKPGDVTDSGAIVAVDENSLAQLSLLYDGRNLFLDGCETLKKQKKTLHGESTVSTADVLDESIADQLFTEEEQLQLAEFEHSVPQASIAAGISGLGHESTGDLFLNQGSRSSMLTSLTWFPPAGQLCQAKRV